MLQLTKCFRNCSCFSKEFLYNRNDWQVHCMKPPIMQNKIPGTQKKYSNKRLKNGERTQKQLMRSILLRVRKWQNNLKNIVYFNSQCNKKDIKAQHTCAFWSCAHLECICLQLSSVWIKLKQYTETSVIRFWWDQNSSV